jgi:hypothetical protein
MKTIIRLGLALLASALISTATPALADHEHWLETPGTCVEDIARGQTDKAAGEGGHHRFHENVHLGQPGESAFDNGPVTVGKGTSCPE